MKLVIMIPCLNEAETLPLVFETMPKSIPGIDQLEILVIDDASTDNTYEVAKSLGVDHFIRHKVNRGLAISFREGLKESLRLGADIIVITDGDNQYPQEKIPELIQPILDNKADVVIADRQTSTIKHFSLFKKFLQVFGTWVLNKVARSNVADGTSGFRAYSRDAAMQLNLVAPLFATETVIQSGNKGQKTETIIIKTNPKTRESRVMKSTISHARKSAVVMLRSMMMYQPYKVFISLGVFLLILGLIPFGHYAYIVIVNHTPYGGLHHIQTLIIGGILLNASFIAFTLGFVADLIRINRILIEDLLENQKKEMYKK